MPRPCLPGKHVWIEQTSYKGQRYLMCDICETTKD